MVKVKKGLAKRKSLTENYSAEALNENYPD